MPVSGAALAAVGAGAVLGYASFRGVSVLASVRALAAGKPLPSAVTVPITGGGGVTGGGGTATGQAAADDSEQYIGEGYIYGGPSSPGRWDCSSFANYVYGHDLGLKIPGGSWALVTANGTMHGPATGSWLLFGQMIPYGSEQPGDVLVTIDHMGICIGGGMMVSAQDPQSGVGKSGYRSGFPGGTPAVRRVT